ncbi:MAG TPA: FtsX-like permease family protein, partial [Vicinamibacterales bacterium]|nr:FtsX-like permease family protein [Vicinamibacterales bacterium]
MLRRGAAVAVAVLALPSIAQAQPPILVTRQLAARAHLAVGDVVTFAADPHGARATQFRVAGIYEPTPDPMRFTIEALEGRLHLPDLMALVADSSDPASTESVSGINVKLLDPADADRFAADLAARVPGLAVRAIARPTEGDPFAALDRFHLAISIVTVVGSTSFLLALMVLRAEERREVVGILRLLGISRRSVLLGVALEGLLIAFAGAAFGAAIGVGGEGLVNRIFQARYDTALVFVRVTLPIVLRSIALAVPLGIAAGVVA